MSETLYPHEMVAKYIRNNVYRFDAAFSFVWAGICLSNHDLITFIIMFCIGLLFQGIDYKYRGLN